MDKRKHGKQVKHFITVHGTEIRRHELIKLPRRMSGDLNHPGRGEKVGPDGNTRRTVDRSNETD